MTNKIASVLYFAEFCISVHSCFITNEEKQEILDQREEKRVEKEFEEEVLNSPGIVPPTPGFMPGGAGMVPRTPGFPPVAHTTPGVPISPFTPRHLAFNRLGSQSSDLPLRDNSTPTTQQVSSQPPSPEIQNASPVYFPPPPKKAKK